MKKLLTTSFLLVVLSLNAQYQIGHMTKSFIDVNRNNRSIQTEIYYPATAAGNNTTAIQNQFPVIVFGHGFVMAWDAYQNIWEELVPQGYIVVFPRTEGNAFSTNHQKFGWDLQFLVTQMQVEGALTNSILHNVVHPNTALMGHSMGGGASFLAADSLCVNGNFNLKTLVGLAPAESSSNGVSSIASAANITVPSLILSGIQDGVTPPSQHHIPMYNALASNCKTILHIKGGAHCYFANSNAACDFGESTSSSGISITRQQQHQVFNDFVTPWLEYTLKSTCGSFQEFQDSVANSSRINYNQSCSISIPNITLTVASQTNVSCNTGANGTASVNNATGGSGPYSYNWTPGNPAGDGTTTITGLTAGTWTCTVTDGNSCSTSQNISITQPTALSVSAASQTNVTCNGGANGAASVSSPTGGTGPYTYNWTPGNPTGDGTTTISGLTAGTWTCTVTDGNSCSTSQNISITQPTVLSISAASQTNVTCNGGANGVASVTSPTGGTGSYSYNWTPGNPTGDGTTTISGLTAGSWTCTVTDGNSCSTSQNISITQPTALSVSAASQTNVTCNGGANGVASVTSPTGGTGSYSYNWTPGNPTGDGTSTVTGLISGTWTCTVTDAVGCYESINFTISQPLTPEDATFSFSASTYCSNENDPTPIITGLTGGLFSAGTGLEINSNTGIIDLSSSTPGSYTVNYATSGNCSNDSNYSIIINPEDNSNFNYSSTVFCPNANDPTPIITGLNGGTFSSSNGLSISSTTGTIDLSASNEGTYSIHYTTAGTCPSVTIESITIGDNTAPIADLASLPTITEECSVSNLTAPTATDNCSGSIIGTQNASLPITTIGTTQITWTYTDPSGNTTTQLQDVVISDNTAPIADIASLPIITEECSVSTLTAPTATDNCSGLIIGTHDASLPITAIGTTQITWTFTDSSGNTTTQQQNIIITPFFVTASVYSQYTLTSDILGDSYQWLDCDNGNSLIVGEIGQFLTITSNGNYAVIVSDGDCIDTSNCVLMNTIGLDESKIIPITIYPNPSYAGTISIQYEGDISELVVVDLFGRIVSTPISKDNKTIFTNELKAGEYQLRLITEGTSIIKKIVILNE